MDQASPATLEAVKTLLVNPGTSSFPWVSLIGFTASGVSESALQENEKLLHDLNGFDKCVYSEAGCHQQQRHIKRYDGARSESFPVHLYKGLSQFGRKDKKTHTHSSSVAFSVSGSSKPARESKLNS